MKIKKSKRGFSLVEIMVSVLVLAVLALGGAAVLYHTGGNIQVQGNKRIAVELANLRMEIARNQPYIDIVPEQFDLFDTYYLRRDVAGSASAGAPVLEVGTDATPEEITLRDITYSMLTKIVRLSADSSAEFDTERLEITVVVEYRGANGDEVEVRTILIPSQVTQT